MYINFVDFSSAYCGTNHRSNLKHASKARARVEDKENKAQKDVKVAEDHLRLTREELQAIKGDLWAKVMELDLGKRL